MTKRIEHLDTAIQIVGSNEITTIRDFLDKNLTDGFVMELYLPTELIDDCFSYAPMNAASGIKMMLMEQLMISLDEYLLEHRPPHYSETDLKKQLTKVGVTYDGLVRKI